MGQGPGIDMSCGAGHRQGSDLVLLWLWRRPAAAAPIRSLAWEPPYAMGAVLKRQNKKKKKRKKKRKENIGSSRHGTAETNPTKNHEVAVSIPGLAHWVNDLALP